MIIQTNAWFNNVFENFFYNSHQQPDTPVMLFNCTQPARFVKIKKNLVKVAIFFIFFSWIQLYQRVKTLHYFVEPNSIYLLGTSTMSLSLIYYNDQQPPSYRDKNSSPSKTDWLTLAHDKWSRPFPSAAPGSCIALPATSCTWCPSGWTCSWWACRGDSSWVGEDDWNHCGPDRSPCRLVEGCKKKKRRKERVSQDLIYNTT